MDALAEIVVQVGDLMAAAGCPISSLDANPVMVGARDSPGPGAVVVDVVVTTTEHPYQLVSTDTLTQETRC